MKSCVLQTREVVQRHIAANVAKELQDIVQEWAIEQKLVGTTTDNARNIVKAVTTELRWSHFSFFSHTLQLAVMQGIELPQVSEVICHCNKVVTHFNHSYVAQRELETKQAQLELPQKKLIQSMPTHWSSSYKMLERLLKQ